MKKAAQRGAGAGGRRTTTKAWTKDLFCVPRRVWFWPWFDHHGAFALRAMRVARARALFSAEYALLLY